MLLLLLVSLAVAFFLCVALQAAADTVLCLHSLPLLLLVWLLHRNLARLQQCHGLLLLFYNCWAGTGSCSQSMRLLLLMQRRHSSALLQHR
jgi:hypothetical protein